VTRSSTEHGGGVCGARGFDHFERQCIGGLREFERDGGHSGSGAVLDRESEIIAIASQAEIRLESPQELGGSTQGLAGALLRVVDDDDGDAVAALQLAQIGEQRRDLAAGVLVDVMQAYEGIEHRQARRELGDRLVELCVPKTQIRQYW